MRLRGIVFSLPVSLLCVVACVATTGFLPADGYGQDADITIIAFGDSITYGRGSSSNGPATGYPVYLKAILEYNYPGYTFRVINAGDPGQTTEGGLDRIDSVLDAFQADFILIMEGTNDLFWGYSYEFIQEDLKQMARKAAERGVTPVLATIIPTNPAVRYEQYFRARSFYLGGYVQALNSRYGIPYADQWTAFASMPNFGSLYDSTGVHPNDRGYRFVMAPEWYDALAPLLEIDFEPRAVDIVLAESEPVVLRGGAEAISYDLIPSNDLVMNGVDCYAALRTPNGRLFFFNPRWQLTGSTTPIARGVMLNEVAPVDIIGTLSIGSNWALGRYTFYLVTVRSLCNPWNVQSWTSNLAEISFVVTE
jgi:lysophospholipase L1-like esterase